MKFKNTSFSIGSLSCAIVAGLLTVVSDASAQSAGMGWYGGLNAGQSRSDIDTARVRDALTAAKLASTLTSDNRDTGYKLFAGYKVNRNFAIEGGYFDLGRFSFAATTVPAGTLAGSIKLSGWNLDGVGILPVSDKFSLLARLGAQYAEARDSLSASGAVAVTNPSPRKRATNYKAGLGAQYDFTPSIGMRAEAERYRVNDGLGGRADVDLISLGLVFKFQ